MKPRLNLLKLRESLGLSQQQVAEKAQISRSFYALIESGRKTPSLPVAHRIAKALETSVEIFFEDEVA